MTSDVATSWWVLFNKSWGWSRFGWKKYAKMGLLLPLSILIVPWFTLVGNILRLVQSTANGYEETPEVKYNLELTKEGFWGFFVLLPAYLIPQLAVVSLTFIFGFIVALLFGYNASTVAFIEAVSPLFRIVNIALTFWILGPIAGVYANERSFKMAYAKPVSEKLFLSTDYLIGAFLYVVFVLGTGMALIGFALVSFLIIPIFIGLGFVVCSYGSYFGFVYYRYTTE